MKKFLLGYVAVLFAAAWLPAAEVKIEFNDLSPAKQRELRAAGYDSFATTLPSLRKGETVQFDLQRLFAPAPSPLIVDPYRPYWTPPPSPLLQSSCIGGQCQRR